MKKKTQLKFIKEWLESTGEFTRNFALANYIGRLASRMDDLRKEGWVFETFYRENVKPDGSKGRDFVYKLVNRPLT